MNYIALDKKDFHKDTKFRPVLNFNFSTHILFRCTSKKYADDFINGKFRFNQPKAWIEQEKDGNKGQGDSLEGVFLATDINDKSKFIEDLKKSRDIEYFVKDDLVYFRNKKSIELYCFCLYGLNSNMFVNKEIDRFNEEHFIAKVDKKYFDDFSGKISEKDYFEMDEYDRPVVLFINNPHEFFEKIKAFFIDLGVPKENIIISPVDYVDLREKFINSVPQPYELLLKDMDFSNQSEVRIIINSTSKKMINYMKEHNNVIDIGKIDDLVTIYDYYFHDLLIEKRGNTIYFTLPFPEYIELSKLTLRELLSHYIQIYNDKLPYETTIDKRKDILKGIEDIIREKYQIYLSINNGQINLSNVNENIEDLLDK